jgi:vacuolar-type H+-ATPase catalytic subunit A/Vma1
MEYIINKKTLLLSLVLLVITNIFTFSAQYYFNKHELQHKREQLKYINELKFLNRQLDEFYYPLQSTIKNSKQSWLSYKKYFDTKKIFHDIHNEIVNQDTLKWQRYMLSVFLPIHEKLSHILQKRNELASKNTLLAKKLNQLEEHIAEYKIVFLQWKDKDVNKNFVYIHFPIGMKEMIEQEIEMIQKRKRILQEAFLDV